MRYTVLTDGQVTNIIVIDPEQAEQFASTSGLSLRPWKSGDEIVRDDTTAEPSLDERLAALEKENAALRAAVVKHTAVTDELVEAEKAKLVSEKPEAADIKPGG